MDHALARAPEDWRDARARREFLSGAGRVQFAYAREQSDRPRQDSSTIRDIALDSTNVFWVGNEVARGVVQKCSLNGCNGTPTRLFSAAAGVDSNPAGIALDATNVYWADENEGTIKKCAIAGCNSNPTVLATKQSHTQYVAVDAANVYWTIDTLGTVLRCAIDGCNDHPTTLATKQGWPWRIATDGTNVYWTNFDALKGGSVMSCARCGCGDHPTTLAWPQWYPGSMTIDATSIYWSNYGDFRVMRVATTPRDVLTEVPRWSSKALRDLLGRDIAHVHAYIAAGRRRVTDSSWTARSSSQTATSW